MRWNFRDLFWASISLLGSKLGPILVQLPPWFKKDLSESEWVVTAWCQHLALALSFSLLTWTICLVFLNVMQISSLISVRSFLLISSSRSTFATSRGSASRCWIFCAATIGLWSFISTRPSPPNCWYTIITKYELDLYCFGIVYRIMPFSFLCFIHSAPHHGPSFACTVRPSLCTRPVIPRSSWASGPTLYTRIDYRANCATCTSWMIAIRPRTVWDAGRWAEQLIIYTWNLFMTCLANSSM